MLHEQLGRHLPGLPGRGIGVVCAIELQDAAVGQDPLRFGGIDEGAVHVDVPVEHIVLRVLVRPVHPLLGKQHRDLRTRHTTHVGMEVDRPAHLVLDRIECLARGPDLLARDRNAADTLRGALDEPVDM